MRQGKHFELEVDDAVDDETLQRIAGDLLANPVIEDWVVTRTRMRIGVITFPGSLDDVDAARAVRLRRRRAGRALARRPRPARASTR